MPIIRRFERWIRSYDSAIAARTPSRFGPFAAQSRDEPEPYSLPAMHDRRHALVAVAHRRVVDRRLLAVRQVHRPRALAARDELVPQAHVRERAAHHHLVVAAARAVRVELAPLDAVLDEVLPGGRVRPDRAGRRDVVGRDRVAEHDEAARADDVLDGAGLARHAVEVRRQAHVRRVRLPREEIARRGVERPPAVVAGEDVRVRPREHRAVDRAGDRSRRSPRALGQMSRR